MPECWLIDQHGTILASNKSINEETSNPLMFLPIQTLQQWFIHEKLPRIQSLKTRSGALLVLESVRFLISPLFAFCNMQINQSGLIVN